MCAKKLPYKNLLNISDKFIDLYGEITDFQIKRYNDAFSKFKSIYSCNEAYIASSSGRVEVCGNHTDHNGGKVVCCAINLDSLAMFLPNEENVIRIYSENFAEMFVDLNKPFDVEQGTSNAIIMGIVQGFKNKGLNIGGFNAYVTSNVLLGAGISSSASFELLIAEILSFLYNNDAVSEKDKAIISQYSEREFFGKPCGLLDQCSISYGGLRMFDFSKPNDIIVEDLNDNLADYSFVLVNTGGTHENLTDEYASVSREMFEVAKCFGKERLIEVSEEEFYSKLPIFFNKVQDRAISRAIHFFNENKRVDELHDSLINKDYKKFLGCIKKSGISSVVKLQNCYVTGSNNQPIIKALSVCENYINDGANRVHGGGFAGCILNVVNNNEVDNFIENITPLFGSENIIKLKLRTVGTTVL